MNAGPPGLFAGRYVVKFHFKIVAGSVPALINVQPFAQVVPDPVG